MFFFFFHTVFGVGNLKEIGDIKNWKGGGGVSNNASISRAFNREFHGKLIDVDHTDAPNNIRRLSVQVRKNFFLNCHPVTKNPIIVLTFSLSLGVEKKIDSTKKVFLSLVAPRLP